VDIDELLRAAWQAVERSGVPESLHSVAFTSALGLLTAAVPAPAEPPRADRSSEHGGRGTEPKPARTSASPAPEAAFFARLSEESGLDEDELRQVLHLTPDGSVQVMPPTRRLGKSLAEQARTVVVLIAGGRYAGLNERPIDSSLVRTELQRKNCYNSANFAAKHVGPLKGFNLSGKEILVNPKWVAEFDLAVAAVAGRGKQAE
jgi:hypothetical protein